MKYLLQRMKCCFGCHLRVFLYRERGQKNRSKWHYFCPVCGKRFVQE